MRSSAALSLRLARLSDVEACAALDGSYSTEHTWQVVRERPVAAGDPAVTVTLRPVRLPRARAVTPPDAGAELEASWDRVDVWVVAELDGLAGYMLLAEATGTGRIERIVVDSGVRRRGVGGALLDAAFAWARERGLAALVAVVPARNFPAISLLRAYGYRICGYNERHEAGGDVAIYLARDVPVAYEAPPDG